MQLGTTHSETPNKMLKPTTARRTFTFQLNKIVLLQTTLAFGGGRSACSRWYGCGSVNEQKESGASAFASLCCV